MLNSRYAGSSIYIIYFLVDLATKAYSLDYSIAPNNGEYNSAATGIYKVTKWAVSGTTQGGTNLITEVPCEVYENGTLIGTTTANTKFALSINPNVANQSKTYIIIPV